MKYFFFTLLILSHSFVQAQIDDKLIERRAHYYTIGMAASVKHFDSVLQQQVIQRTQNKINENDFLERYDKIEIKYKAQADVVAQIAEKWAVLQRQRPSRTIKSALSAINGNHINIAVALMQAKRDQLNDLEQYFFKDLYLFIGEEEKANALSPKQIQDSIALIWENKFDPFTPQTDTLNFVLRKLFIAQKFKDDKQVESAIGTLLEAQKWNDALAAKDIWQQKRAAHIAQELASIQFAKSDIDNAFKNAKSTVAIYDNLLNENIQPEYAKALHTLAQVYQMAGANKEAETYFYKAIAQYEQLNTLYPERYKPLLATVLEDFAQVQLYYDLHAAYEKTLLRVIDLRRSMAVYNNPFNLFQIGKLHNLLGQKKMNADLKVYLAQAEWLKSKTVLDSLNDKMPILAGQELCSVLYKLGGSMISLKKRTEALSFFVKSLSVRTKLYQLLPTNNKQAYLDVLVYNGSLNAWEHKNNIATLQLDQAAILAEELGDIKRAQEIRKFKKDVLTH